MDHRSALRPAQDGADPKKQLKYNPVWRYADGKLTPVITDMTAPNGIAFSPDEKTLYVSNSMPKMYIRAYDVGAGGKLSNPRDLISFPPPNPADVPDGMKVDSAGNLWAQRPRRRAHHHAPGQGAGPDRDPGNRGQCRLRG